MSNPQKICVICGLDCSAITRYQSPDGRYYCQPCYEKLMQQAAATAAPPAPPPQPALRIAPAAAAPAKTAAVAQPGVRPPGRTRPGSPLQLPLAVGGGLLLVFVLLLILARIAPVAALGYLAGMALLALGLGLAVLVSAFRTSLVQGLLTFFVPFYALYYIFGVSRSRLLMTLTPLCLALGFGVFLLPGGEVESGFDSGPTADQPATAGVGSSTPRTAPELSDGEVSKRIVAGHSVAIAPRANVSSFGKMSGGRQIVIRSDGKRIELRCDQPLRLEQWEVGTQNVMIVNNELLVDYRNYGALDPGAEILVNNGAVFVGGKPAAEHPGAVRILISP